ncbi:MAG TPA: histidine phosphatase family protein [Bacteroidia bacterium]|nr:histidine phosphatase family protein [Bacteroidia bacterium]
MKQLFLIRHGKSDWDHPGLSDHDRTLNDRGRRDAPRIAAALAQRGVAPDAVLTSTAVRAATTAAAVATGLGLPPDRVEPLPELYLAPPATILRVVQGMDEAAGTAMVFGHNPGMHEAVNGFDRAMGVDAFPTLAVARLEFAVDYWGEIEWGTGTLVELILPRELAEA